MNPQPAAAPDTRARELAQILGKPPRIQPIRPDGFTDEMRRALAPFLRTPVAGESPAKEMAELPEMLATLVRHPELFRHHVETGVLLLSRGALSPRDRELAVLRIGWLCQAPYEWGEHVQIGKRVGLSEEEIERLIRGSAAPGWSDRDRAIVGAVEELHRDAMISDATWEILARDLDDQQLIEFVMLVGHYQTVAYYQNALRIGLRDANQGLSAR